MPFGLRNAGQTFQLLIDQNFRDLPFCFPFADDNLVGSANRRRHLEHLWQVFQIIEKCGLALNIAKCEFGQPSVAVFSCGPTTNRWSPPWSPQPRPNRPAGSAKWPTFQNLQRTWCTLPAPATWSPTCSPAPPHRRKCHQLHQAKFRYRGSHRQLLRGPLLKRHPSR